MSVLCVAESLTSGHHCQPNLSALCVEPHHRKQLKDNKDASYCFLMQNDIGEGPLMVRAAQNMFLQIENGD